MITHLKDYTNRLKKYSQTLDNYALLLDQPWLVAPEKEGDRCVYIFRRENKELIISNSGIIEKAKWDYIPSMKSLIIERNGRSELFNQGFFNESLLILKKDGTDQYKLFANENKVNDTIDKLLNDVENKLLSNTNSQQQDLTSWNESYEEYNDESQLKATTGAILFFLFLLGIVFLVLYWSP
jgi:hypothetical protein